MGRHDKIIGSLFFFFIATQIALHPSLISGKISLRHVQNLWNGTELGYPKLAQPVETLKPWLPTKGVISIIMDHPSEKEPAAQAALYRSSANVLVPLVLNQKPVEKIAVVFCADSKTAELRLRQFGYVWIYTDGNGLGVAQKAS